LGCVALYYGSEWFVSSSKELALSLGVEERVVGLTVVALGTSLPEMVTAAVASFKGETDLALGNLMGSNIFNILSILGITAIITPIHVHEVILNKDIIWMLMITLMILPLMIVRREVGRADGIVLLIVYSVYIYTVVV
jgi:cation:H+ antiporter